jgi:hypothetical protein
MRSPWVVVVLIDVVVMLSACKKSHEEAVKSTREACTVYLNTAQTTQDCDKLAALTMDVAKPFQDISNEKEMAPDDDDFLTKCMDQIADDYGRCKDNTAFKKAMDKLLYAAAM